MISRRPVLLSTSRRTGTGKYPLRSKEPAVFKFVLTFLAIAAGMAKRLPLFRPASIERELEQTLCLVRCCRHQREKAAARRPVSAV
jgi:hypothetical protein